MKGLPGALDVEKFAEARAFEIDAMHQAMKSAGCAMCVNALGFMLTVGTARARLIGHGKSSRGTCDVVLPVMMCGESLHGCETRLVPRCAVYRSRGLSH